MKNIFANLLLLLSMAVSFTACDGEVASTLEVPFCNIYDVKEGGNNNFLSLVPLYADTAYSVKKTDAPGLSVGDRALVFMKFYNDFYAMPRPEVSYVETVTKITRHSMSRKGSFEVSKSLYNSAFPVVAPLPLSDYPKGFCTTSYGEYLFADGETQNVSVAFDKGYTCEHKMTIDSLRDGVLYFRLYAHLDKKGWEDSEAYEGGSDKLCKILSYNMDWDLILDELTTPEKEEIVTLDSLSSHISLVVASCKKDADGLYIPKGGLTNSQLIDAKPANGKFANGLYKGKK